jgi:hypothetical protein
VLGGLLLLLLVVVVVYARRSRNAKRDFPESSDTMMYNPAFNPNPDQGLTMYIGSYHRAVSFHYQRYMPSVFNITAEDLGMVYDVLQVPRPHLCLMTGLGGKLKTKLDTKIRHDAALDDDRAGQLEDVVQFVQLGFADALMEDMLDMYLEELMTSAATWAGDAPPAMPQRSIQLDFAGLRPTHWAPFVDPLNGMVSDVEQDDVRLMFNEDYAKRRTLSIRRNPSDQAYSYAFEVDPDPLYDAADDGEAQYDAAHALEEPEYQHASAYSGSKPTNEVEVEAVYDLSDPMEGSMAFGEPDAVLSHADYDLGAAEPGEDSYALARGNSEEERYSFAAGLQDEDDEYHSGPDYETADLPGEEFGGFDPDEGDYDNVGTVEPTRRGSYLDIVDASDPLGLRRQEQRDSIRFREKPSNSNI